ncbi:N-acylglucosamine 2-epimerase (GlcNAc 2-epimerase) [Gracilaria domingensis]|nr:N-acylglucosamine 2-epimerase (GlcNAc 2-epimerase) [Gracilaria domingensis]
MFAYLSARAVVAAAVFVAFLVGATAASVKPSLFDAAEHRETLLSVVDAWNSGAITTESRAGEASAFHVNLNDDWTQVHPKDTTAVAQARGVYINVEAAAAARAVNDSRGPSFVAAVKKGIQALDELFRDPADGGVIYLFNETSGTVSDSKKDGYANVHTMFAFAMAATVLDDAEKSRALLSAWQSYEFIERELDDGSSGGLYRSAGDGDDEIRNLESVVHFFEGLLSFWDVLPNGNKRNQVAANIARTGNFIVNRMLVAEAGDPESAFVAFNYKPDWTPTDVPYTRENQWDQGQWASPGHNIEIAWLLSRAEQRGLEPSGSDWVAAGERLIRFTEKYAIDAKGLLRWEEVAIDGMPFPGNPDNDLYEWWSNCEAARTYVHFALTRGCRVTAASKWRRLAKLLDGPMTDKKYGGWFRYVTVDGLKREGSTKWDRWKVAYHFAMLQAEILRLGSESRGVYMTN